VPAGWRPSHHSVVQVIDSPTLRPVDVPVRGIWRVIDRAPESGWWLQPSDEVARGWLLHHGQQVGVASGMINVHGLRLVPAWLQLPIPGGH
jgi:hypothetical protein